ncbi:Uncharacterized protein Fot_56830 [Forsythia ovata]|uniref:Uncharacterized protein n=1 Tax=Forsythia ovata TaxID=205694 RepID=A0ABD1P121_9LAMI
MEGSFCGVRPDSRGVGPVFGLVMAGEWWPTVVEKMSGGLGGWVGALGSVRGRCSMNRLGTQMPVSAAALGSVSAFVTYFLSTESAAVANSQVTAIFEPLPQFINKKATSVGCSYSLRIRWQQQ